MVDRTTKTELCNMCMIIDNNTGKVLVQDKIGKEWFGITFPGGHVEPQESFLQSVVREVKEETGLTIDKVMPCGVINWCHKKTGQRYVVFLYKTNTYSGQLLSETIEGKVFWMEIMDVKKAKLAPNMIVYLELFLSEDKNEAYAEWDEENQDEIKVIG